MPKSWINHIQNIQQEPITTSRMDRTDNEGPNAPKETQHVLHRRAKLQKLPMKTILLKQRDQKNLLCHQHKSRPKELPLGTRKKKKLNNTLLTQWPFTANDSLWQLLYIDSWWYLGATTSHPAASLLLESTPWSRLNGNPSCWSSAAHFFSTTSTTYNRSCSSAKKRRAAQQAKSMVKAAAFSLAWPTSPLTCGYDIEM